METDLSKLINKLQDYFAKDDQIVMAFLFGSIVRGETTAESDVDIAIYFKPIGPALEWEEERVYSDEDKIWGEVEKIIGRRTDLVILNRAPAGLASTIIREGQRIVVKDQNLYWRFLSAIIQVANDFREFTEDFWVIKQRSASLSKDDRSRLIRILDFLEHELRDREAFLTLDQLTYQSDANRRRNFERWSENMVNAAIDLAKIILASEKKKLPQTYRETLADLAQIKGFDPSLAEKLALFAKLRNILSHEYLDLRFVQLKKFVEESGEIYQSLIAFVKKFLQP